MPGALGKGHVLRQLPVAADQDVGGHPERGALAKVRVGLRGQVAGEQPVDPRAAELPGRQADAVHDDELRQRRRRARESQYGESTWRAPSSRPAAASIASAGTAAVIAAFILKTLCGAVRDFVTIAAHDFPQRPLGGTRSCPRVAPVHADEGPRARCRRSPSAAASGAWLEDFDGKRYLDAVSSWWVNLFGHAQPGDQRRGARAAGGARAGDPRRLHARAGDRTLRGTHRARPARTHALLLRRQRLLRGGGGREDELPLLAQRRPQRQAALHHPRQQLPRRDPGGARRRQRRALQGDLPAAAHGGDHRALPGLLRPRRRGELGGRTAARSSPTWRPRSRSTRTRRAR